MNNIKRKRGCLKSQRHPLFIRTPTRVVFQILNFQSLKKTYETASFCDPDRIRTCDPQLRRLLLYPTELPDPFFRGANI